MGLVLIQVDDEDFTRDPSVTGPLRTFPDLESWEISGTDPTGFILAVRDRAKGAELLNRLRSNPQTTLKPIFLSASLGETLDSLSDGIAISIAKAVNHADQINRKVEELDPSILGDVEDHAFRLLGYLFSRPDKNLEPHRCWTYEQLYRYPLMEHLGGDSANVIRRIENLRERGLLHPERLVDRVRHCPHCDGAHLNFIDSCPHCESIDILQQPFLHCFTCGHVSSEEQFISPAGLACPNCRAKLRHIGTDYDRALESYSCHGCGHVFSEPKIIARCQHCTAKNAPEDLVPRNIHSYRITDQGVIAARTGSLDDVYALLDSLNNINPAYFTHLIDWVVDLSRRYPEDEFSIIGIRLSNIVELTDKIGRRRTGELMDGFAGHIRSIVRGTDLTSRTTQRNLWLLLPKTPASGCQIVLGRILETQELSRQSEGIGLEVTTVTCTAPEDVQEGESAKLLLARLTGSLQ